MSAPQTPEPPVMTGTTLPVENPPVVNLPPPAGAIRIADLPFTIAVPDLRNGDVQDIPHAAPRSSMSALYHWPVIKKLPADQAVNAVEYLIRSCYAQMCHVTGPNLTNAIEVELRKKAIVLGAIRAGALSAYNLKEPDMTRAETTVSGMVWHAGTIAQDVDGTTSGARWTLAQGMSTLDPVEMEVIGLVVYIGMAVPVLQGVSLVMSGHHYIPPTYAIFKGMKKQALGSVGPEPGAWITSMGDVFDDMAFHKSCHPIQPGLKRSLSKSSEIAHRLRASGHGAAAIRLPAVPSEASGGKAAIALVRSASDMILQMGHTVDVVNGIALMKVLEEATEGTEEIVACEAIIDWIAKHSSKLAFCAGIVNQVHETSGLGTNTILRAFSVRRLMAENPAAVNRGAAYARAANAKLRQSLEDGTFEDPNVVV